MNAIFKKLNFKNQPEIHVLNAPDSFQPDLREMAELTKITVTAPTADGQFILIFVKKQSELSEAANLAAKVLQGDGLLWIAYPKKSSKKYTCDFDRDSGWSVFGQHGFEGVRMVAIDEDWSALRLRRVEFIKTLERDSSRALSDEGKKRSKKT